MRILLFSCSIAAAMSPLCAVWAEGSDVWIVRGVADLAATARIELTESAEPLWHEVSDPAGQTLSDVLDVVCGVQPPEVTSLLEQEIVSLNRAAGLNDIARPGNVVAVPFCLKIERNVEVVVREGDTPSTIMKREYGVFGEKTMGAFFKVNASPTSSADFEHFAASLPVGRAVTVPLAAPERVHRRAVDSEMTALDIINAITDENIKAQLRNSIRQPEQTRRSAQFAIHYEPSTVLGSEIASAMCGAPEEALASTLDVASLQDRFEAERNIYKAKFGKEIAPTLVGIIDTGVAGIGNDFFPERFFHINVVEANGQAGVDDDRNKHADDIYGSNFYELNGDVGPLEFDREKEHGTKMAALLLGGVGEVNEWVSALTVELSKLIVINFSGVTAASPVAPPGELAHAVEYLSKSGAAIINMSISTESNMLTLENLFRETNKTLFVVAAGNSFTEAPKNLSITALYPARYGGARSGNNHVITVGAHNKTGERAVFSNYSSEYVDLLAPGCEVPTRLTNGDVVLDSGTSPATATVSFVASLISDLGPLQPNQIKTRLLASTDFDSSLEKDVWSSGRLNPLKAISLYHDVVQLNGENDALRFGRLSRPEQFFDLCVSMPNRPDAKALRKIIPNLLVGEKKYIEFWVELDGSLSRNLSCEQNASDADVVLIDNENGGKRSAYKVHQLQEVVFSAFRFET